MIWAAVLGAALSCYLVKLAGLSLPDRVLDDVRVQRLAATLPVALLAALVATQTLTADGSVRVDVRVLALVVAVVALALRAPFLVVVVLAAATAALTRLL